MGERDWDRICRMPRTAEEHRECSRRGLLEHGSSTAQRRPYPAPRKAEMRIAGTSNSGEVRWAKCTVPAIPQRGRFDQWTILQRNADAIRKRPKIASSADAYRMLLKELGRLPQEEFVAVYLNNQNQLIGTTVVSRGTSSEALVNPSDVLRPGLLSGSTRMIIAHNHPSGDTTPSPNDAALTKRIKQAGEVVGIQLLDSLVISDRSYASLRDLGIIR